MNSDAKPPVFELTDPAIHYSKMTSRKDFGQTDRGEYGIQDFLETHTCSKLCHMLLDRWIDDPLDNDIIQYEEALNECEQASSSQSKTRGILVSPNENNIENVGPKKAVHFG